MQKGRAGEPANFLAAPAPAPDFFFKRLRLLTWLSLAKYVFPRKIVDKTVSTGFGSGSPALQKGIYKNLTIQHIFQVRIEKFYAFWGQDLDSHTTPMECGRGFRCKMKSDIPFIGLLYSPFTEESEEFGFHDRIF